MASLQEHLNKLREERMAREKARIDKLRELNLKKYNKNEPQPTPRSSISSVSIANRPSRRDTINIALANVVPKAVKNNFHVNGTSKRPITASSLPNVSTASNKDSTAKILNNNTKSNIKLLNLKTDRLSKIPERKVTNFTASDKGKVTEKSAMKSDTNAKGDSDNSNKIINNRKSVRKSFVPTIAFPKHGNVKPLQKGENSRKSILPPKSTQSAMKPNPNRQSVFERLYQPKPNHTKPITDIQKIKEDPDYLKKVIKASGLILNRRQTVFEPRKVTGQERPVRRSISAVHFKRINGKEINNCIHKWSSIGDKLDKVHLQDINEDESVQHDNGKVVSAIKSERKHVKFLTPVPMNLNTPKPEELQARLQTWLKKRGKCLDSYHHLQCFGIHHLAQKRLKPINLEETSKFQQFDEEDKENLPVESDSDNESYADNMNDRKNDFSDDIAKDKWRRVSSVSDSVDFNETMDITMTPGPMVTPTPKQMMHHIDDVLFGALNDLTELLREGFDWEQCARWLRAIRERFQSAPETAAYWECRAALEERRGDLPASVQCWEEAIAKGTERSVVEANLDQLLDKFMQLKISPNSGKRQQIDPKLVDVKNVFKSTLIRFAVQQAKLRQSNQSDQPKYTVTPVRRSARLSGHWSAKRTPLQVCTSVRQAGLLGPVVFVPNDKLHGTP